MPCGILTRPLICLKRKRNRMVNVKIDVKPMPSPRPRVYGKRTIMPKEYVNHKEMLKWHFNRFEHFGKGKIRLEVLFAFKMPARGLKRRMYDMPVPDIDNLVKTLMDSMQGILFDDDRQIVEISAKKIYSEVNCYIVKMEKVNEDNRP